MTDSDWFEVEFLTLVYGGDAMGRLPDGRAVFVPDVLPGERARVRLVEQKKNFARGRLIELLSAAPERIQPIWDPAACGGCHYAHIHYPAQLGFKTAILRDQLQRIAGIDDPPVAPIVPSPREWQYRNTAQFHIAPDGRLGFQQPGTRQVVPAEQCPLCEPAIDEVRALLDFSGEDGPPPGLERVQVRVGAGDDVMIVLESADPVPPEFSIDAPVNAVFIGPGGFEENEPLVLAGDDYILMEAAGRTFRVSAGSFFQVNTAQAENMLRYLLDTLPLSPGDLLLEVYAGVGLFSAFLAERVDRLVAVEASPSAVIDFAVNLDAFENVELYEGPAEEVLPALELRPDLVLVDPPRAGLERRALDALVDMKSPLIAYISCDPATLARDAKRLLAAGYRLQSAQPFDMFPQTYHIESISIFVLQETGEAA